MCNICGRIPKTAICMLCLNPTDGKFKWYHPVCAELIEKAFADEGGDFIQWELPGAGPSKRGFLLTSHLRQWEQEERQEAAIEPSPLMVLSRNAFSDWDEPEEEEAWKDL